MPEAYTFWDLHVAIQDAMGWWDRHLHEFEMSDPILGRLQRVGLPDDEGFWDPDDTLAGWDQPARLWFSEEGRSADYRYGFGDDWRHSVKLEKVVPREVGVEYPVCLAGRRACPPEDCGGTWG